MNSKAPLLLAVILSLSTLCWSQEVPSHSATVQAATKSAWKAITNGKGSGASVAIMHNGKLVYSAGMGVKDWDHAEPVSNRTRFNIGSTSKMFVAVAVLLLVDEGKVDLDQPVTDYIPDFQMADERYREITVRMLFNHSSGLPGSSFSIGYDRVLHSQEILLSSLRWQHLKHKPGALSMYCNDAFTLAEILVARVSGTTYLSFLKERVLEPLGMHDTGASVGELPSGTDLAEFVDRTSGKEYPPEVLEAHGAGGLSSTPEDLCRFGDSLSPKSRRRILSEKSLKVLTTTQPTEFTGNLRHREMWSEFGWDYSNKAPFDSQGLQVLGKGGNTLAYSTNLQIVPDQNLTLAMCVSGAASGEMLTHPILRALLQDLKIFSEQDPEVSKLPASAPIPKDLQGFAGFYGGDADRVVEVTVNDDKVVVTPVAVKGATEPAAPLFTLSYHDDGILREPGKLAAYFTKVDGVSYLISTPMAGVLDISTIYAVDYVLLERLEVPDKPKSLEVDPTGKLWLVRNAPTLVNVKFLPMVISPDTYEKLPGYLNFSGLKRIASPDWAAMAVTHFRDQSEMRLRDGGVAAEVGPWLYTSSPAPVGVVGGNTVVIGAESHNEWLEISQESVFGVTVPKSGRVAVVTPGGDILFDSVVDSGKVLTPKGALIFCAGPAGTSFRITLE